MKIDPKCIIPRYPWRSLGYTTDFAIAFLPAIILSCIFISSSILAGISAALLTAIAIEFIYSIFTRKELDLTIISRALALCICLPAGTPLSFYFLGGGLVFMLGTIRGFTDKYVSIEPVTYSIMVLLLFIPTLSPTHYVINGVEFGSVSVLDLLIGNKTTYFGAGSIFALAFAYIYLFIRKRISFINGLLFYAALIATLAFLYTGSEMNAIYYVSFIALDAKVFFSSFILLSMGALPFTKKAAYLFSLLGGGLLGIVTLKLGFGDGIYYVVALISLLSRPMELLICKLSEKKAASI